MAVTYVISAGVLLLFLNSVAVEGRMMYQLSELDTQNVQDECWNLTFGLSEHIRSPGYPDNYTTNVDCRKIIKAGPDFRVQLKFLYFHLEASENCKYDSLEIRDGMYGFSPLLFRGCLPDNYTLTNADFSVDKSEVDSFSFSENVTYSYMGGDQYISVMVNSNETDDEIPTDTVFESSGQYMWLRFVSDAHITRRGFLAKLSASPKQKSLEVDRVLMDCYTLIEGEKSFRISDQTIPEDILAYYRKNPDKHLDCVWDIKMPPLTRVFLRITNYTTLYTSLQCEESGVEVFDVSTAQDDARGRWCMKPLSPWISGASRAILHLYSTSLEHLPEFEIIGNVYIKDMDNSNCSNKEQFIGCHDGYCIPASLKCNQEENCGEGYDEDCYLESDEAAFETKYIALFLVVVISCILLTTTMTLQEVWNRRKAAQKDKKEKEMEEEMAREKLREKELKQSMSRDPTMSSRQSIRPSMKSSDRCVETGPSCVDEMFPDETFRSSRLNENVSFKKPKMFSNFNPAMTGSANTSGERIYAMPNTTRISLPHVRDMSDLPPAPPTPPPPPAPPVLPPPSEGRGFRLIHNLTDIEAAAASLKPVSLPAPGTSAAGRQPEFQYPPPPSFLRQTWSHDTPDWSEDYTSTSSSSITSLPGEVEEEAHHSQHRPRPSNGDKKYRKDHNDPTYDTACLERRRRKSHSKAVEEEPHINSPLISPKQFKKRSYPPKTAPKPPKPKSPTVITKKSWTFDDSTDDGAMELTTYISTC